MSLLFALILGALVGWLAARVMGRDEGIIVSIIIGIVGAIIGGFLFSLVNNGGSYFLFSWTGLFWSFIGSLIFAFLLNVIWSSPSRSL